jgi:formylglycine-generating enzyme required for sulfatase activity
MEYETGEPLSRRLSERGTLSEGELIRLLRELLNALEAIHTAGYLHRDLKPSNIYINQRYGHAVLLDFGAAREALGQQSRTVTNLFSPGYSPPEQYTADSSNNGAWSDIYALGAILYHAVTGNKPLDAVTRVAVRDMPPAVRAAANRYDAELLAVIDKALEVKPEERYQSIGAMQAAFTKAINTDHPHYGNADTQTTTQLIDPAAEAAAPNAQTPVYRPSWPMHLLAILAILGWGAFSWSWWQPFTQNNDAVSVTGPPVKQIKPPQPGHPWSDPLTGLEFVWVAGGCFTMGSPPAEAERDDNEAQSEVCVKQNDGFWISRFEISNSQYQLFLPIHNSGAFERFSLNGAQQPVAQVNWKDAVAYARWLSAETGQRLRLPTESEWEYAARAGSNTARYWGPRANEACVYANVHDISSHDQSDSMDWLAHTCNDAQVVAAAIGSYQPNAFGLYDMLGNVWEWTISKYATDDVMPADAKLGCARDPLGCYVIRGGSWYSGPATVRSAVRRYLPAQESSESVGFRLVIDNKEDNS